MDQSDGELILDISRRAASAVCQRFGCPWLRDELAGIAVEASVRALKRHRLKVDNVVGYLWSICWRAATLGAVKQLGRPEHPVADIDATNTGTDSVPGDEAVLSADLTAALQRIPIGPVLGRQIVTLRKAVTRRFDLNQLKMSSDWPSLSKGEKALVHLAAHLQAPNPSTNVMDILSDLVSTADRISPKVAV